MPNRGALTHFLIFGPNMEQGRHLNEFYALLQQGTDQKKAFQQIFGDLKELQNSWSNMLVGLHCRPGC
jgi:hypothetical protein